MLHGLTMNTERENCTQHALWMAFPPAAQSERDELTRWRDPKVELPNDNRDVLVKTTLCREYCIAFYKANGGRESSLAREQWIFR